MTISVPGRLHRNGPIYLSIVEALAEDIAAGRLASGDRLPPQRELADRLGVTLTTVTRAYIEAARRGLVEGEVGRGTFVRAALEDPDDPNVPIDLSLNALLPHAHAAELAGRLSPTGPLGHRIRLLDYHPPTGMAEHRRAARMWLEQRGWDSASHDVVITAGAQHGLLIIVMAVLPRGGEVLVEDVTYSGLKRIGASLGLALHGVAMDPHGLRPADLDAACRRTSARVLYTMPALQNPTGITMSVERQEEIAAIARRYDLTIIEDDTYGFLVPEAVPLVARAPERTLLVTSLSKSVSGGFRIGYVAAPSRWLEALGSSVWSSVIMASPVTADIATALVKDGTAVRVMEWKREEARTRQALARKLLPNVAPHTHPASPHVWLPLERPWRAETFAAHARARGVLVTPATAFSAREGTTPRAVRVALGPPRSRERLEVGLTRLAQLQREEPGTASVL
jgi:DNA-binding transcriptional MocR family regulator